MTLAGIRAGMVVEDGDAELEVDAAVDVSNEVDEGNETNTDDTDDPVFPLEVRYVPATTQSPQQTQPPPGLFKLRSFESPEQSLGDQIKADSTDLKQEQKFPCSI